MTGRDTRSSQPDKGFGERPAGAPDGASVPEHEIVAVRTGGPHNHITEVRLADGSEESAVAVMAAVSHHAAHYVMRKPDQPLPFLVRVQQCPDCLQEVIWA